FLRRSCSLVVQKQHAQVRSELMVRLSSVCSISFSLMPCTDVCNVHNSQTDLRLRLRLRLRLYTSEFGIATAFQHAIASQATEPTRRNHASDQARLHPGHPAQLVHTLALKARAGSNCCRMPKHQSQEAVRISHS